MVPAKGHQAKAAVKAAKVSRAVHAARHKAAVKAAATRKAHAAKAKKRQLARPGENCVLDACHAVTRHWLDLDAENGLFIPGALEMLWTLGLITGFAPVDLEEVMPGEPVHATEFVSRAGLILGVDLPGPHAVLATPDGAWWSWGEPYDPAAWPDAVIEEAWEVRWPQ